jgi:hypothetical protein
MKKLVLITAVIACAAMVMAQTVTSQNIVGYSKKAPAVDQFLMVSPQFLADTGGGMTLGEAFGGVSDQSVIFSWNGSAYTKYTYFSAAPGWFDNLFTPSDGVLIGQGDAVWLKGGSAAVDVIMAGEVPSAASITNNLVVGFNMIANPYPVALTLGDLPAASISDQDVVFTWNGSAYTKYTYFSAAPGWFDNLFTPSDSVAIPVGDGFWLDSGAGGTLILDKQF